MMLTSETNSRALVRNSIVLSAALAALAVVMIAAVAVLGAIAFGADFALWASAAIAAGASLGIATILLRTWQSVRYMLVETIAAGNAKHNAEAQRILAEADRLDAESAAIARAADSAAQVNVNSGPGHMTIKNKPITYTVAGQVVNGNALNQINQAPRTLHLEAADVLWFAEQLANGYGHSKSKWVGKQELPYSRLQVDWTIYKTLVDPLASAGGIVGRGERASGRLIETQPAQLVKMIEATHPGAASKGITLELPAALP